MAWWFESSISRDCCLKMESCLMTEGAQWHLCLFPRQFTGTREAWWQNQAAGLPALVDQLMTMLAELNKVDGASVCVCVCMCVCLCVCVCIWECCNGACRWHSQPCFWADIVGMFWQRSGPCAVSFHLLGVWATKSLVCGAGDFTYLLFTRGQTPTTF